MKASLIQRCLCPYPIGRYNRAIVQDKRVLVIGSGSDLDGRGMGDDIDGGAWDAVVRANKVYGNPRDTGSRTDVLVISRSDYLYSNPEWLPARAARFIKTVISLEDHMGYSVTEFNDLRARLGSYPSTGMRAVDWVLNNGAAHVDVIGFGWRNGGFSNKKAYTGYDAAMLPSILIDRNLVDLNSYHDFGRENDMLVHLEKVNLID